MKIKRPIWLKLAAGLGIPLIIIYMFVIINNYKINKSNALNQTKRYLQELTRHNAQKLDSEFEQLSQTSNSIKNLVESSDVYDEDLVFDFIVKELESDPDNVGSGVAFYPEAFQNKKYANFIHRKDGEFAMSDVAAQYDYLREDWFVIPAVLKKGYWSDPFWGRISETLLMLRAYPIMRDEKLIGVSYADISLKVMSEMLSNIKIMNGYTFIISKNGTFIYHPREDYVMVESIFSLSAQHGRPELRELGRSMLAGKSGVESYNDLDNDQKKWIVYTPIQSTGWTFAAVIPEEMVLSEVRKNVIKQFIIMFAGLIIVLVIIIVSAKRVSVPMRKLVDVTERIAYGELDVKMETNDSQDEIAALQHSFVKMVADLKLYINNLTNVTQAKEAVESEMRIARQIQESLLPQIFPAFPHRKEFDLYAKNIAAKEVAGDFYDFFFLNDNVLAVIIADVSGKGISAGLFMAVTRTLLKTVCSVDLTPAEALNKANYILCQDNDACMFTTLFLGFYDVSTGVLTYCNAGHDYPIIISESGTSKVVKTEQDIALGIDDEHEFHNGEIKLGVNESLILYTDGVIEATDADNNLFGEDRFIKYLEENHSLTMEELINNLTAQLADFQSNRQFDDITLLFLKRNM